MKQYILKHLAILIYFFGIAIFLSGCDSNCESLVCIPPKLNIGCQCRCPFGVEGDFCDIASSEKFIGNYFVSESCRTTTQGIQNQSFQSQMIPSNSRIDQITINNFANRGLPVEAFVDKLIVTIPSQSVGAISNIEGFGRFQSNNSRQLRISYTYTVSNVFFQCESVIFNKQ